MNNVLSIVPKEESRVSSAVKSFIKSSGVESKNTMITYETAIKEFFKITRKKSIEELTERDLNFNLIEVERYRSNMIGRLKSSTINNKMIAVKRLFDKLVRYGYVDNSLAFEMKKLKQYDTQSYDSMSIEEVKQCIDIAQGTQSGYEKGLLIHLAFVTGFRKHALMTLKFSNMNTYDKYKTIKVLDKGNKWSEKKISSELYQELKDYQSKVNRENIFNLSNSSIQRMMNKINKDIDFGGRNITFHSFKKASVEEIAIKTNYDLKAMQAQGNHADVTTTLNIYMSKKKIEDMPMVDLDDSEPDLESLNDLSKDELLNIISKLDRKTQMKIINMK